MNFDNVFNSLLLLILCSKCFQALLFYFEAQYVIHKSDLRYVRMFGKTPMHGRFIDITGKCR